MVSDKMIGAMRVSELLIEVNDYGINTLPEDEARSLLTSGIDAAWVRFTLDDPTTHPRSIYAPSGKPWATLNARGDIRPRCFDMDEANGTVYWYEWGVYGYADPVDLLPSWAGSS